MLSPNSFIRNAPRIIAVESRLRWEVLVNSSDAITFCYSELKKLLNIVSSIRDLNEAEYFRSMISVYCWTIIDHTHAIMQIFRILDRLPDGQLDTFVKTFGPAISDMRNGMDHIHQKIGNLAKKKTPGYGLYGNIAFTTPRRKDNTFTYINFGLGGIQFDDQIGCPISLNVYPLNDEVGNVVFASFDTSVNISEIVTMLSEVLTHFDISARNYCINQIAIYAAENEIDFDEVMKNTIKGTVYIEFNIAVGSE